MKNLDEKMRLRYQRQQKIKLERPKPKDDVFELGALEPWKIPDEELVEPEDGMIKFLKKLLKRHDEDLQKEDEQMKCFIDRDNVISLIDKEIEALNKSAKDPGLTYEMLITIQKQIDIVRKIRSSVLTIPRVHMNNSTEFGELIRLSDDYEYDTECSECGQKIMLDDRTFKDGIPNFCPWCGAEILGTRNKE